ISAFLHGPAARLCPAVLPYPEAERVVPPGAPRRVVARVEHARFAAAVLAPDGAPPAARGIPAALAPEVARHARSAAAALPDAAVRSASGRGSPEAAVRARPASARRAPARAASLPALRVAHERQPEPGAVPLPPRMARARRRARLAPERHQAPVRPVSHERAP